MSESRNDCNSLRIKKEGGENEEGEKSDKKPLRHMSFLSMNFFTGSKKCEKNYMQQATRTETLNPHT